jgi:hypothetical protein
MLAQECRYILIFDNWFDACINGLDHKFIEQYGKFNDDKNPQVTKELLAQYRMRISSREFSVAEINYFIKAASFVVKYHQDNKEKINWCSCLGEKTNVVRFAHRFIEAIVDDAMDVKQIEPTWLCSIRTTSSRFPKYLRKTGLMNQENTQIINKEVRKKREYNPGYRPGEIE